MNKNIDLTKILKDCPKGWKFYSSIYGDIIFDGIGPIQNYPIIFSLSLDNTYHISVTKQGQLYSKYVGDCTVFPSKNQRDWSKFTAPWYKNEKFDPNTLKPFDKVLVRDTTFGYWECEFFSHHIDDAYPYVGITSSYKYCIPYNDETKHLVGTTDEAPEFYKYWEN